MKNSGVALARNTLYNFGTQAVLGILAFVSIPAIIHGLGEEAFGVLTLIWTIVGYFSLLDFGVGQASVKFLAEQIGRGAYEEAGSTIWVSMKFSLIIGLIVAVIICCAIPIFLAGSLHISGELLTETRRSFYWVAIAVPFVLVQGVLRAIPMAIQRFDVYNLLFGLTGLLQWGGSLAMVLLGLHLSEIALLTAAIRIVGALSSWWIVKRMLPQVNIRPSADSKQIRSGLLRFGGWVTISQVAGPVMRYIDRVIVVSLCSLRLFTFYVVPYEAVSRLLVIPLSFSTSLFPAMAERSAEDAEYRTALLYKKAINFTVLVVLPLAITLAMFGNDILRIWLGGDFPAISGNVFKILALAMVIQSVGFIPVTTLQAIGRPDIAPKFYLIEIPIYVSLCFILIPILGIDGAAWAWLIRIIYSTAWLLWKTHSNLQGGNLPGPHLLRGLTLNAALFVTMVAVTYSVSGLFSQAALSFVAILVYVIAAWRYCLDSGERRIFSQVIVNRFGICT